VLSCTIDKFCWISARRLPPFFAHKSRIVWSKIELVNSCDEIEHPTARECLKMMGIENVEVHYDGDLPGQSGLGSSSSFTVCLLHALHGLKGQMVDKRTLAEQAIEVEQSRLSENVGCQDQVAAAYGGVNRIQFLKGGGFHVEQLCLSSTLVQDLEAHMTMFFVGSPRHASGVAASQVASAKTMTDLLRRMAAQVDEAVRMLAEGKIGAFGTMLHGAWTCKKTLSLDVSNETIDDAYAKAIKAGALGGKLLGAGSGGFLLVFRPPEKATAVSLALAPRLEVRFKLENNGSQIIHYS
jgi:D-glycero-alpha-D-manno-heptose-7-phosphate kinase